MAAKTVLQYMGKSSDDALEVADLSDITRLFSLDYFNGDGVVVSELSNEADARQLIHEVLDTQGGSPDRSGVNGVTSASVAAFYAQAQAVLDWLYYRQAPAARLLTRLPKRSAHGKPG